MNDHHCDVIGCPDPARWIWRGDDSEATGNFLCSTHWQELKTVNPQGAVMYCPIGAVPRTEVAAVPHTESVLSPDMIRRGTAVEAF